MLMHIHVHVKLGMMYMYTVLCTCRLFASIHVIPAKKQERYEREIPCCLHYFCLHAVCGIIFLSLEAVLVVFQFPSFVSLEATVCESYFLGLEDVVC